MSNADLLKYNSLLTEIKQRVRLGQIRAGMSANSEMLAAYWDIGKMIHERQQNEAWGSGVIQRLSNDLKNELSEIKGFSVRNIQFMIQFYHEYCDIFTNTKLPVSQLDYSDDNKKEQALLSENTIITKHTVSQLSETEANISLILSIQWSHHIILIQKIKDIGIRFWLMQQSLLNGWSRDTLISMIKSRVYERQGNAITNFEKTLPPIQSALAKQILKDPYVFDFTTLATEFTERELEIELVKNIQNFLIELGAGFAFVGRQYRMEIGDRDISLDLLFYHLKMRCFVVIDLKRGEFLPEYAGKMNFYCSAVDDLLRHKDDSSTIGLILCQQKNKLFAEYALKDINKAIGISEYEFTRVLPDSFKGSLPSVQQIEDELSKLLDDDND